MNIVMDMSSYEIEPSSPREEPAATMAAFDAQPQLALRLQAAVPDRSRQSDGLAATDAERILRLMVRQGGAS